MSIDVVLSLVLVLMVVLPFVVVAVDGLLDEWQRRRDREEWLARHEQIRDGNY